MRAMTKRDRTQTHPLRPLGLMILAVTAVVVAVWLMLPARDTRRDQLASVERWTYQLQGFAREIIKARRSDADMLVIDYAIDAGEGMRPLTRAEVDALKRKPDGGRRLVIAYFSIGEAEEYRPYWQDSWRDSPPDWIIAESCRWPKNHLVRFWDRGWSDIVFGGPSSYLAAIQAAGFDGVYLDRVDVYADISDRFPQARGNMIGFVEALAAVARGRDPGFLVIVQNAEELLEDAHYRAVIDAVAKEDLIHGVAETGKRNPADMISGSVELLDSLQDEGKPIFAVEYLTDREQLARTQAELARYGYVGVFPPRALDGSNPFNAGDAKPGDSAPTSESEPEPGTPEYAEAKCDGVWKRAQSEPAATPAAPEPSAAMQ